MTTKVYTIPGEELDGPKAYATKGEALVDARIIASVTPRDEFIEIEEHAVTQELGRGARLYAALISGRQWSANSRVVARVRGRLLT